MDLDDHDDVAINDVAAGAAAVDVLREGTAVVSVLTGEIDSLTAPAAQAAVAKLVTDGRAQLLVVDLSAVTFLSSRGIALLVEIAELAQDHAVELRVVTGTGRVVVRPLELTGLIGLLPLFRTRAEALTRGADDLVYRGEEPGPPV